MNADVAAKSAARLHAAAATVRGGYPAAASNADRNERQTIHQPPRTSRARVLIELEVQHNDRDRRATAHERRGPSPLFMAQYFAQETARAEGDAVVPSKAATGYTSLGFDQDILLPGSANTVAADGPRLDILV